MVELDINLGREHLQLVIKRLRVDNLLLKGSLLQLINVALSCHH